MAVLIELPKEKKHYKVWAPLFTIGRSKQCSMQLENGSISNEHAKITCKNGKYYIADTSSRNGTFVNGLRVLSAPIELFNYDELRFAVFPETFRFELELQTGEHSTINRLPRQEQIDEREDKGVQCEDCGYCNDLAMSVINNELDKVLGRLQDSELKHGALLQQMVFKIQDEETFFARQELDDQLRYYSELLEIAEKYCFDFTPEISCVKELIQTKDKNDILQKIELKIEELSIENELEREKLGYEQETKEIIEINELLLSGAINSINAEIIENSQRYYETK